MILISPAIPMLEVAAAMREAALAAGDVALRHFRAGANTTARISYKSGGSPVTEADLAADAAIRSVLSAAVPDAVIYSEEAAHETGRFAARQVFVVDPIDGTRAFIQGRSEWCVSIALMEAGKPVAGVIHAPARHETFEAVAGGGARLNGRLLPQIDISPLAALTIAGPKPMLDRISMSDPRLIHAERLGALAYRLAVVASGAASAALASEGSHDWDIAAAEVILAETGCVLLTASGQRPVYNAVDPVHPALVAAPGGLVPRLLALVQEAAART